MVAKTHEASDSRSHTGAHVVRTVAAFWILHIVYRTFDALVLERGFLLDRALLLAFPIGILLSIGSCLLLARAARRGLAFAMGASALLSVPTTISYATAEMGAFLVLSPVVNPATVPGESIADRRERLREAAVARQRWMDEIVRTIATNSMGWYFFFFGLASFFVGISNARRLQEAERRASRYEALAKDVQLSALRHQINPHFLFNTLNSLSALVMAGDRRGAETMILNLATFFRATLDLDPAGEITVSDEFALQRLYLEIEQVRFQSRLSLEAGIDPGIADALVPTLLLQPLVENAVKHGVAKSREPVVIRLAAHDLGGGRMSIVVENSRASGTAFEFLPGRGVGLWNVRERLKVRFGDAATLSDLEETECAHRVVVNIPARRG